MEITQANPHRSPYFIFIVDELIEAILTKRITLFSIYIFKLFLRTSGPVIASAHHRCTCSPAQQAVPASASHLAVVCRVTSPERKTLSCANTGQHPPKQCFQCFLIVCVNRAENAPTRPPVCTRGSWAWPASSFLTRTGDRPRRHARQPPTLPADRGNYSGPFHTLYTTFTPRCFQTTRDASL